MPENPKHSAPPEASRLPRGRCFVVRLPFRPHGRCNAAALRKTRCHAAALPAIVMCFRTTINERPPTVILRRSRRISCTGVPYRNPPARDPSPLAQDDMLGVRRLFHNNDGFGGLVPWDGGTVETHAVGRGLAPAAHFPEPGHPLHMHRIPKSVIANQRARWCGNPFPRKP